MHRVMRSTEGVIILTVAQKGMKWLFYNPTQNLQRVIISAMLAYGSSSYDGGPWQMGS